MTAVVFFELYPAATVEVVVAVAVAGAAMVMVMVSTAKHERYVLAFLRTIFSFSLLMPVAAVVFTKLDLVVAVAVAISVVVAVAIETLVVAAWVFHLLLLQDEQQPLMMFLFVSFLHNGLIHYSYQMPDRICLPSSFFLDNI